MATETPYLADLARVHHEGFGHHATVTAPGILELLDQSLERGGTVLELGCGSGPLTRELVRGGHRVIATDASPAMLDLARDTVPDVHELRLLVLPDDPLPEVDAIVSVGHVLSYLPSAEALDRALVACASALRPGGLLAIDLCDVAYGECRAGAPPSLRVEADWVLACTFSLPEPNVFVRDITTFVRTGGDSWRRSDERHRNVLVDVRSVAARLGELGVDVEVGTSFGNEELPDGLLTLVGRARTSGSNQRAGR